MSNPPAPPRLLTIAGSDSGGGAGIQADLKTFAAHGVYGMSVITAITAQNTVAVTAVHELEPELVQAQLDAVFDDIGVDAVKIGMLSSPAIIEVVASALTRRLEERSFKIVLDPVMVSKSGVSLLQDAAVEALLEKLLPLATVVTPNMPEAERLTGKPTATREEREAAARKIAASGPSVLLKGGHDPSDEVIDLLFDSASGEMRSFVHRRIETSSTHGTGCTLSSAVAARLGRGERLDQAVAGAIRYLQGAIGAAYPLGSGHGPVDHLYLLFSGRRGGSGAAD